MIRRVVIIDDDPVDRDELQDELSAYPNLELVGSFDDPDLALPLIKAGEVEGVFLDIDFLERGPRLGLKFAEYISRLPSSPWIIFITEHSEEDILRWVIWLRPFGFINKPINRLMLETALKMVDKDFTVQPQALVSIIEVRYHEFRAPPDGNAIAEKVFITRFLAPKEIKYIQSNQGVNTIKVYLVNGEALDHVTLRLNQWLNFNLPCFVQISRNTVVNLKYVSGFEADTSRFDAYLLKFRDCPLELPIGQVYFPAFREALRIGGDCCK